MASGISRLRFWFGISALLAVAVVAGFYFYARYRVQRAVHDLPAKLGVNIQQNTEGFTYSQAAGGHTIYSITASNAVRYKQGGKAELHQVKIVSYGRDADRLDLISGDRFDYDAHSGQVSAVGNVAIELQAAQPGTSLPGSKPKTVGDPVHLQTSGLVFNQKTGMATTREKLTFQYPQGSGSAVGATYDSKQGTLNLDSDIHLLTSGPQPVALQAGSAVYLQNQRQLTLTKLETDSGVRSLQTEHAVLHLRDDNTIERADGSGGVNVHVRGPRPGELHAALAHFVFGPKNQASSGVLSGAVTWQTAGNNGSHGSAGKLLLDFAGQNQIRTAQFRDHVDMVQAPAQGANSGTEFHGDGLDLHLRPGNQIETATSVGSNGEIVLANAEAPAGTQPARKGKTTITASRFDAKFAPGNRIDSLHGAAPVKIVSSTPGQLDRTSDSDELLATFSKAKVQQLEDVVQTGNVHIQQGQRTATADRATYNQTGDTVALSGNVRYHDSSDGSVLTSNSMVMNRATGETTATGNVKTTYAEAKAQPSGAMLASAQAVHVTAEQMVAHNAGGTARYTGSARLWQGGNIVQAPEIDFNRVARTLDAQGQASHRVSTVFVQTDRSGKESPLEVTADHLHYEDAQRRAVFEGAVVARSTDSTMRSSRAIVLLRPLGERSQAGAKTASSDAPSAIQTIDAMGDVHLQQPGRRAIGARLLYTAQEGKFVLTGTPAAPPSIFDAEHGQVTGVSLTFYNRDDRVLVDSSNSGSITQSRLEK